MSSAAVSACSPDGLVVSPPDLTTAAASLGTRATQVTTRPRAIAGNSASGPIAACGVSTPMRITVSPATGVRVASRAQGFDHEPRHFGSGVLLLAGDQPAVPDGEVLEAARLDVVGASFLRSVLDAPG